MAKTAYNGSMPFVEFVDLALGCPKAEFVRQCPFYFLLSETALEPASGPRSTGAFAIIDDTNPGAGWESEYTEIPAPIDPVASDLVVVAVRKVQREFPSMITVGRTRNNDVVLNDVSISRSHAFFREFPDRIELSDAGSLVGTWVGSDRLVAKGPARRVEVGQTVRFARHEFVLLDADGCWIKIRATKKP